MNTKNTAQNFCYRLGRGMRRLANGLNRFELNMALRVQTVVPRFGYALTRIVFFICKLAVIAGLFLALSYAVLFLLVAGIIALFIGRQNVTSDDDERAPSDDSSMPHPLKMDMESQFWFSED